MAYPKITSAKFVKEISVTDPESKAEVHMSVFKHEQSGGMFAIDSSFLDECFDDNETPKISDPLNKGYTVHLLDL